MKERTWYRLMEQARREARVNGERRKVIGVRTSPRMERAIGKRWIYIVQCGSSDCLTCRIKRSRARG